MNSTKTNLLFSSALLLGLVACSSQPTAPKSEVEALTLAIQQQPQQAEGYFNRAQYYFKKPQLDSAYLDIQYAVKLDSNKINYLLLYSDIELAKHQYTKTSGVKKVLDRVLALDSNNMEALLKLAELHMTVTDYPSSIKYVNKVIQTQPNNAKAYFVKGMVSKMVGDTNKALTSFKTTIEQDPQYVSAYEQLALLYATKQDKQALYYLDAGLSTNPNDLLLLYNKALLLQNNNELETASKLYEQILSLNPNHTLAYHNLGWINLVKYKKYDIALNYFKQAINTDSLFVDSQFNMAICYEMLQKNDLALKQYQEVLRKSTETSDLYQKSSKKINTLR